jgi:hypothetical protein
MSGQRVDRRPYSDTPRGMNHEAVRLGRTLRPKLTVMRNALRFCAGAAGG